jgi:molybdenum cofactor cytidylyltransferase
VNLHSYLNPLTDRAKTMRANMTTAERRLWFDCLKPLNHGFRKQRPIGRFIVDFYAPHLQLVIEVDGNSHDSNEAVAYDEERTIDLQARGLTIMRFTNDEVMQHLDAARTKISHWMSKSSKVALAQQPPSPGAWRLIILILASGRGERFKASGGATHKLDAPLGATTVLQATVDQACRTGLFVHVERSNHAGMGDTIAAAVAANKDADGWLMLPADMPFVPVDVMLAVARGLPAAEICVPVFQGQRGHPVGFSKRCLNDLLALTGDEGARSLLQRFEVTKITVDDLPQAAGCLIDIDTRQDLESVQKSGIFG